MCTKLNAIIVVLAVCFDQLMSSSAQWTDSKFQKIENNYEKLLSDGVAGDNSKSSSSEKMKPWIFIEKSPKEIETVKLHDDLTLKCEVSGSPPPVISWFKNGKRIEKSTMRHKQNTRMRRAEKLEFRLGRKDDGEGFVMAQVVSKLFIHCINPEDEGQYTCVARNAAERLEVKTVVSIHDNDAEPQIAKSQMCKYKSEHKILHKRYKSSFTGPSTITFETLHMESIGNNVLLPCQVTGFPKAKITWYDPEGKDIIPSRKFKLSPSGSLLIRNVEWKEMGEYTCQIETQIGGESSVTFLYPVLPA